MLLALVASLCVSWGQVAAQTGSRFFGETGHTVRGAFLAYWNTHGALPQQGYPITDEFAEVNTADGKSYTTQYFQRSRFEFHPEQTDPNYQVLLGLLGLETFLAKHPGGLPPSTVEQIVPGGGSFHFNETGYNVTGLFLSYWQTHGGLAQQGYPITPAYLETNDADGNIYVTQYFQRARFEYHPEQSDPQYKVLLGLVGNEIYLRKQHGGQPSPTPGGPPAPTPTQVAGGCTNAVHPLFQFAVNNNPALAGKLGCPTDAGFDYNVNKVKGGYQPFKYGPMIILTQENGPNYAYGLYTANNSFHRVNYGGVDNNGGSPPLPGKHFYGAWSELGNMGPSQDEEDFGDAGYQTFQNGLLIYIGGGTQKVFALYPANSATGTWEKYDSR